VQRVLKAIRRWGTRSSKVKHIEERILQYKVDLVKYEGIPFIKVITNYCKNQAKVNNFTVKVKVIDRLRPLSIFVPHYEGGI
jgi:hypothetical protein